MTSKFVAGALAGALALCCVAVEQARASSIVNIQPVSICLDNGTSCGSLAYDATAVQNFWQNQAGLTLNILPSRTFNSTTYQTIDNLPELNTFLTTNADPSGPTNFTASPITVWFSNGFVGGPLGLSLIDANRSWVSSDQSTDIMTWFFAHELGHTLGLGHVDLAVDFLNLMNPIFTSLDLGDYHLTAQQVSTVLGSRFVSVAPDPTPLPAALPLFATGLGALGLLGWRRKRKQAA